MFTHWFDPATFPDCKRQGRENRTGSIPKIRDYTPFAERGGFEPPVPFNRYGSLANCWFQPLTHLSSSNIIFQNAGR